LLALDFLEVVVPAGFLLSVEDPLRVLRKGLGIAVGDDPLDFEPRQTVPPNIR
jgi:hypothetical protein